MNKNKDKSISSGRQTYIATLIVTLIAIWFVVSWTFLSFYFIARSDAETIGAVSVAEQSEKLNNFLLKGSDVLKVTATTVEYMLEMGASKEEIYNYLIRQSDEYAKTIDENFTGIYGFIEGTYLDGMGWVPEEGYDPITRPWYVAALEGNGEPVIVSPYVDAQTNSIMISISQLLSDGKSVVSLDIVMDDVQDFAKSINLNGKGYGFIVDAKGLVVAHSQDNQKGKNYLTDKAFEGTTMQMIMKSIVVNNEKTISIRIDGNDSRVFSKKVQDSWYVVMIIDVHDLFEEVEDNLVINILLSFIIYGVLAFFIASSYRNRNKAMIYAEELKEYQSRLEERVEEQTVEIKRQADKMIEIQENAVESMAILIESRDGNTGEHVKSTKTYVSMILEYMYDHKMHEDLVTQKYIKQIKRAATLHDVGKVKVSDVILNKPGRFTTDEYEVMKQHAIYGGDIVQDILGDSEDENFVENVRDVAKYHHEKWDGTGYPEGRKGEDIPLGARIMAVADVFDALISKRVYKDALPIDEAFEILQKDAGSHFDPEVVEVFVAMREEVENLLNSNKVQ